MAQKPAISFIGLGAMGFGMATHLLKEGFHVTGFDIWGPTLERFKAAGGASATSPAEAVKDKDYCVCMVATAQQAQDVLVQAIPALPKGAALLLASTVPCGYVQSLEKQLVDMGRADVLLVDCPVSGGVKRAAAGTLSIMVGASDAARTKTKDLLLAMANPAGLYIMKGGVGAGSNMKMVHQVLAVNHVVVSCEALGFASHLGLELEAAAEGILASEGKSWMFEDRLPRLLHPEFQPIAAAVTTGLKDIGIITSEARRHGFPTPLSSATEQAYLQGVGRGYGSDDDAGLLRLYTEGKGNAGPVAGTAEDQAVKLKLIVDLLRAVHLCSAAETLAFAHRLGLDLDQVFHLCVNAAGGSRILEKAGPEMINVLRNGVAKSGFLASSNQVNLGALLAGLRAAIDEAQRLKAPMYLGNQAMVMLSLAGQSGLNSDTAIGEIVRLWVSSATWQEI